MLQLVNNVGCVFMKFVNEGKCTIRLCEPPVDICVSKVIIFFCSFRLTVIICNLTWYFYCQWVYVVLLLSMANTGIFHGKARFVICQGLSQCSQAYSAVSLHLLLLRDCVTWHAPCAGYLPLNCTLTWNWNWDSGSLKVTESCTIRSADPENLILKPNIMSIGKAVAKLLPFLYIQDGRQLLSWILSNCK